MPAQAGRIGGRGRPRARRQLRRASDGPKCGDGDGRMVPRRRGLWPSASRRRDSWSATAAARAVAWCLAGQSCRLFLFGRCDAWLASGGVLAAVAGRAGGIANRLQCVGAFLWRQGGQRAGLAFGNRNHGSGLSDILNNLARRHQHPCPPIREPPPLLAICLKGAVAGAVEAAGCPLARRWPGPWQRRGPGLVGGLRGGWPLSCGWSVASLKNTPMNKGRNRDCVTTKTTRFLPARSIT